MIVSYFAWLVTLADDDSGDEPAMRLPDANWSTKFRDLFHGESRNCSCGLATSFIKNKSLGTIGVLIAVEIIGDSRCDEHYVQICHEAALNMTSRLEPRTCQYLCGTELGVRKMTSASDKTELDSVTFDLSHHVSPRRTRFWRFLVSIMVKTTP